jgi:hypothetical protein
MLPLRWLAPVLSLALALATAPVNVAFAGLEFCFTPECSDGDPCTCDILNPDGTCTHDPRTRWAAAARASGIQIDALGESIVPPTPDSNVQSPDQLLEIPAAPLAHVEALRVEEIQENRSANTESYAYAEVTTGMVRLLDQGGGNWLVTADAIRSVSESQATNTTATSSTEGSTILNLTVNGVPLGDVSEPMDLSFNLPLLNHRVDVRVLQKLPVGAAAGEPVPDPEFGVVLSGVTVNGIRVTVRDYSNASSPTTVADVIVARADSRVDRFSKDSCGTVGPRVSGHGFVLNLDLDETILDPDRQLHRTRIGEVVLPSTGGREEADLLRVGPIFDPSSGNLILESGTAFSHTEGTVDRATKAASAATVSAVEDLDAFDLGDGAQITADLVRAECTADAGKGTLESSGRTTILGLTLGGRNVCEELGLEDGCTPAPNTELLAGIPGLRIVVNEQIPDPAAAGATGLTVNAIHVKVLGAGNELGLPLGADLIVSRAHCDAFTTDGTSGGSPTPTPKPEDPLAGLLPKELQKILDSLLSGLGLGGGSTPGLPKLGG